MRMRSSYILIQCSVNAVAAVLRESCGITMPLAAATDRIKFHKIDVVH